MDKLINKWMNLCEKTIPLANELTENLQEAQELKKNFKKLSKEQQKKIIEAVGSDPIIKLADDALEKLKDILS